MSKSLVDGHIYSLSRTYSTKHPGGEWHITDCGTKGYCLSTDPVVWRAPVIEPAYDERGEPAANVRAEYERLLGFDPMTWQNEGAVNLVEVMMADDDCAFDQPCKWGHRVDGHAVYCHNPTWLYAPGKCRRHQEPRWGDEAWPHEQCAGYCANPNGPSTASAPDGR